MNAKRRFQFLAVLPATALVTALAVAGCMPKEKPLISEPNRFTHDTLVEQIRWVETQFDLAISASGVDAGWFQGFSGEIVGWDGDPQNLHVILGSMMPQRCGTGGQLAQDLIVRDVPEPFVAADRVRAAWEAQGWLVTDVFDDPRPENPVFTAKREDGAMLGFDASADGLILKAYTSCSIDSSVVYPTDDLSARDAFLEEVLAREHP